MGGRGSGWLALTLAAAGLWGAPATALASPPAEEAPEPPRHHPLLVAAGHFVLGPHEAGEEACRVEAGVSICDRTGRFFGVGGSAELRLRLFRVLYAHGRFAGVSNVARTPSPVYGGLLQPGVGLGVYGNMIFARGELMFPITVGSAQYRPAGQLEGTATDEWGPVAGNITAGMRFRLTRRMKLEPMFGFVIGPRADRDNPNEAVVKQRTILSFLAGVGLSFDLVQGRR